MKLRMRSVLTMALLFTLLVAGMTQAAKPPLLPFDNTGDPFVTDSGSASILGITPGGTVTIAVTRAEIEDVAGGSGDND